MRASQRCRLPRGTTRDCDGGAGPPGCRESYRPRFRLIDTEEISLPGDWIEIDC
jgi:hypothetical protein